MNKRTLWAIPGRWIAVAAVSAFAWFTGGKAFAADDMDPVVVKAMIDRVVTLEVKAFDWPSVPKHTSGSGVVYEITAPKWQEAARASWKRVVILTNAHVLGNSDSAEVTFSNGKKLSCPLASIDYDLDVAIIAGEIDWDDIPAGARTPVVFDDKPERGRRCFVVGAPLGLSGTMTEGIVSSVRQIDGHTHIQTSAPASHGSSGGGLFNKQGELLGLVVFKITGGENLNFAISAEALKSRLAGPFGEAEIIPVFMPSSEVVMGVTYAEARKPDPFETFFRLNPEEKKFAKWKDDYAALNKSLLAIAAGPEMQGEQKRLSYLLMALGRWPNAESILESLASTQADVPTLQSILETIGPRLKNSNLTKFIEAKVAAATGHPEKATALIVAIANGIESRASIEARRAKMFGNTQRKELLEVTTPDDVAILTFEVMMLDRSVPGISKALQQILDAKGWKRAKSNITLPFSR